MATGKRRLIVAEDLDVGYGSTTIPTDSGGTRAASKIGLPTFPGGVINVKSYGIVADGITDVTASLQALIDRMTNGSVLYFPQTEGLMTAGPFVGERVFYRTSSALTLPNKSDMVICGAGKTASKIKNVTNGGNCFTSGNTFATSKNGTIFRDLWLSSTGTVTTAGYGIYLNAMSRSQIKNMYLEGWLSGLHSRNSLEVTVSGCTFAGGQDGLTDAVSSGTDSNDWVIFDNDFETQSRYAILLASTPASYRIINNSFQGAAKGAVWVIAGYSVIFNENYFEGNTDGTAGTFDIKCGTSVSMRGGEIRGNYFAGSADVDHYPLRLNNLDQFTVDDNTVTTGGHFISFGSTAINNSKFGKLKLVNGTADITYGTGGTYENIPPKFIYQGNVMEDYVRFPSDGQQYFVDGDLPYGGFLLGGAGTATATRAPNTGATPYIVGGRPVLKIVQTVGAEALVYKIETIAAKTTNERLAGHWVTYMVDVLVDGSTPRDFQVWLSGGNVTSKVINYDDAVEADGWKTYTVSGYVATNATSLQATFNAEEVATYYIANPRLYVGLDARTMPCNTAPPFFSFSAAPTAGTWRLGDFVWNTNSVGATPVIGWICTVAGTPGTWVALTAN